VWKVYVDKYKYEISNDSIGNEHCYEFLYFMLDWNAVVQWNCVITIKHKDNVWVPKHEKHAFRTFLLD